MNRYLNMITSGLFMLIFLMSVSCTDANLCEEPLDEHPHNAQVSYSFNWEALSNDFPLEHDSMHVLAYRVINIWKSSMVVSSFDNPARGRYLYNAPSAHVDEMLSDDAQETAESLEPAASLESFSLRGGEYKFVAFSRNDQEIDYSSVDNYLTHDEMPLNEMNVIYKTYEKGDKNLHATIPDWIDYNPYGDSDRYMQSSSQPIYYDTIAVRPLRSNGQYHVRFESPRRLTQHIEINFEIQKVFTDHTFTVDSVFAEISGIPYIINLATGYIDIQKTKKMMFRATYATDADNNKTLRCKGVLDVPTIVESSSDELFMGPGIMQVMIMCSAQDPSNPDKRLNKKFQGSINLYRTLGRAGLIQYTADRQHVMKKKDSAVLNIDAKMRINGEYIMENPDDEAGLDRWHRDDKNPPIIDI